jgi:toxin ParE1/3/4
MTLHWLPRALARLLQARDYIEQDNPGAAKRVVQRILDGAARLGVHPELGRPGIKPGTRELAIPRTPFLIVYRVRDDRVEILTVLHGARKWPSSIED